MHIKFTFLLVAMVISMNALGQPEDTYKSAVRAFDERKIHEAAALFEKAAASRELPLGAQKFLGQFYANDARKTPQNRARALFWLRKPAAAGDAFSQYYFGKTTESPQEKVTYFELAAQQGLSSASADLMRLYRDGEVPPNPYRACLHEEITSRVWAGFRSWHESTDCLARMSSAERARLMAEADAIWIKQISSSLIETSPLDKTA